MEQKVNNFYFITTQQVTNKLEKQLSYIQQEIIKNLSAIENQDQVIDSLLSEFKKFRKKTKIIKRLYDGIRDEKKRTNLWRRTVRRVRNIFKKAENKEKEIST